VNCLLQPILHKCKVYGKNWKILDYCLNANVSHLVALIFCQPFKNIMTLVMSSLLQGLNEQISGVRLNIMMLDPLRGVDMVFSLLVQQERQM
jgi:hypothetical protein